MAAGLREYARLILEHWWGRMTTFFFIVGILLDVGQTTGIVIFNVPIPISRTLWIAALVIATTVAPFSAFRRVRRQRDDALDRLREHESNTVFEIEWQREEFFIRKPNGELTRQGRVPENVGDLLEIRRWVTFSHVRPVRIESLALEIDGQKEETEWTSQQVYQAGIGFIVPFAFPVSVRRGTKAARTHAIVDGRPYESAPFTIASPARMS